MLRLRLGHNLAIWHGYGPFSVVVAVVAASHRFGAERPGGQATERRSCRRVRWREESPGQGTKMVSQTGMTIATGRPCWMSAFRSTLRRNSGSIAKPCHRLARVHGPAPPPGAKSGHVFETGICDFPRDPNCATLSAPLSKPRGPTRRRALGLETEL